MTTRCHSVRSLRSPVFLSRQDSEVATRSETTRLPLWVARTSGSLPRLPTRMTLLTDPAISPPCTQLISPCHRTTFNRQTQEIRTPYAPIEAHTIGPVIPTRMPRALQAPARHKARCQPACRTALGRRNADDSANCADITWVYRARRDGPKKKAKKKQ